MEKENKNTGLPLKATELEVLYAVRQNKITSNYIEDLKKLSGLKDELLSASLNLNIKTYRSYKLKSVPMKPYLQEHVFTLLSLFRHGIDFFGTSNKFGEWLQKENYYFDNDKPINFLDTVGGIRYTDSRLTSMEYGDNV
ncbi:MAG: MbcA/ParS/Xre antitoxin family protein [Cyclobacteriaceae bacterium]|nr:MbcA/ParS/Xre antitoxin family protein [Cyclobacteriaceae bacterium]